MTVDKRLSELLDLVVKEGGSDLHIFAGGSPMLRIAGELIPISKYPILTSEETLAMLKSIVPEERWESFRKNQSIDLSYAHEVNARFRVNGYCVQGATALALRLVPSVVHTFTELNLPPALEIFTQREQGFFLVVGPVGQGKSTTLASMIELVNRERTKHIITVEDPIEYIFTEKKSIIDQREVGFDTRDFKTALRSMFREDVNIAMIAEMRDVETMGAAVTAAETGHLVLSTLHTNNAAQSIDRIIDTFPGDQQNQIRLQLSTSLLAIFSQRLVPRISGGRVPAYELLINNYAIGNLIRESRTAEITSVLETSAEDGMISMNQNLADLVRKGEITQETAFAYSQNPEALQRRLT